MNKSGCSIPKAPIVTWNRIKMSQTICNKYLLYDAVDTLQNKKCKKNKNKIT